MPIVGGYSPEKQRRGQGSGTKNITGAGNAGSQPGSPSPPGHPKVTQLQSDYTGHIADNRGHQEMKETLYYILFTFFFLSSLPPLLATRLFRPLVRVTLFLSDLPLLPPLEFCPISTCSSVPYPPFFPNLFPPAL